VDFSSVSKKKLEDAHRDQSKEKEKVIRIDAATEKSKQVFFYQLPNLQTRRRYARTQ
jgi:hypothetical protein